MHAFWCALLLVSLVFGEVFFGRSASLHDCFALFVKCFFCNLFWVFFLGHGMKGYGVVWSDVMRGVGMVGS